MFIAKSPKRKKPKSPISVRRSVEYYDLKQPQNNSRAFRIVVSDTSQYSAVVPIFRCPINF